MLENQNFSTHYLLYFQFALGLKGMVCPLHSPLSVRSHTQFCPTVAEVLEVPPKLGRAARSGTAGQDETGMSELASIN